MLEDTLLARRLPAYEPRLRARERRHPKLFWRDPGVARAAKGSSGPVAPEEKGHLLEGWVHTLLRTYMATHELADEIAYWAPTGSNRLEVDFLLRRRVLVHRGERPTRTEDGIDVWPVETFLEALAADSLWP